MLDLGAIAVEHFLLAIDPYPRAPGAELPADVARNARERRPIRRLRCSPGCAEDQPDAQKSGSSPLSRARRNLYVRASAEGVRMRLRGRSGQLGAEWRHPVTTSLDVMGGDHGPKQVMPGADIALIRRPDLRFRLFGDEKVVRPLLDRYPRVRDGLDFRALRLLGAHGREAEPGAPPRPPAIQHVALDRRGEGAARPTSPSRPAIPAR